MNDEWRPIEAAPKDRPYLVWTKAGFVATVYGRRSAFTPTHWMPLPPPPPGVASFFDKKPDGDKESGHVDR